MLAVVLGAIALEPGGFLGWILVGLLAGYFAGKVVEGRGLGCLGDIVVGLAGAFVGGFVFSLLGFSGGFHIIGSTIVAFIGAVLLLAIVRAISGRRA
jgi:uncharacterized membrane protein YeaQ/YmgE (transglycosylase-associated protein family)